MRTMGLLMRWTILGAILIVQVLSRPQSDTKEEHPADDLKCPEERTAYFVTPHVSPLASYSFRVDEIELEKCQEWCSKNLNPQEQPATCASFTYNNETKQCKLYPEKTFPDGLLERRDTKKPKFLYEKYCLPEPLSQNCAKVHFRRVDEKILKGYAQATAMVRTLGDCMSQCIKENDFQCKSAMFFYEEGECITNLESDDVSSEGLVEPEDDDRAIFIQNDCYFKDHKKEDSKSESKDEASKAGEAKDSEAKKAEATQKQVSGATDRTSEVQEQASEDHKASESTQTASESTKLSMLEKVTVDESTKPVHEEVATQSAPREDKNSKESTTQRIETVNIQTAAPVDNEDAGKHLEIVDQDIPSEGGIEKVDKHPELYGAKILQPSEQEGSLFTNQESEAKPAKIGAPDSTKKLKINALHTEPFRSVAPSPLNAPAPPPLNDETLYFTAWSTWTPCKMSGEKRVRRRKCLDLKKCRGSLTQIENCPAELIKEVEDISPLDITADDAFQNGPTPPTRQLLPVGVARVGGQEGAPPAILPPKLSNERTESLPDGAPGRPDDVWSAWLGVCQQFASSQPCKNGHMIGFESRECIAKDPTSCQGPFFRYCMLPC
ncbi:unnamed protein product [Bursaphelenchus okinawaensis]|uniref:Apple domain-containing protein n=1 Tax=Bursaphelenchus okinawaensis TaxID=465554 RepID=A0A811KFM9_9BILA|nr:unnamed protein product [Bursaphelenchus okinawaensis]CAG9102193.1 unnamed protein product [Bursaphelenchus okinawaensis]